MNIINRKTTQFFTVKTDVARMVLQLLEEKSKEDPGAVTKVPPISTFIDTKSRMPKLEALKTIALLDILSPLSDIGRQMSATSFQEALLNNLKAGKTLGLLVGFTHQLVLRILMPYLYDPLTDPLGVFLSPFIKLVDSMA